MQKILIVEDEPTSALLTQEYLKKEYPNISLVDSGYEGLEFIQGEAPDLVLLDLGLPDIDGMSLIRKIKKLPSSPDIIVITGETSTESALEAIQLGARDYLVKPIERERLHISVKNAFERIQLARQLSDLKKTDYDENIGFYDLIGRSSIMKDLYKLIENVAKADDSVLINGEHGSGKSLCAAHIHKLSARAKKPFVTLNAISLNDENAVQIIEKAAKDAEGGVLYMKRLTELCKNGQATLLNLLDSKADIRLICSSFPPLIEAVKSGIFREDLYYRLNILPIDMAPLRQRGEDIHLLANYFLKTFSKKQGKNFKEFDNLSLKILNDYHWPGNVIELENMIRSVVTLNADGFVIEASMLPSSLPEARDSNKVEANPEHINASSANMFKGNEIIAIRDLEQMAIQHALDVCDGNVQEAALKLKISPATLYRKKNISG